MQEASAETQLDARSWLMETCNQIKGRIWGKHVNNVCTVSRGVLPSRISFGAHVLRDPQLYEKPRSIRPCIHFPGPPGPSLDPASDAGLVLSLGAVTVFNDPVFELGNFGYFSTLFVSFSP